MGWCEIVDRANESNLLCRGAPKTWRCLQMQKFRLPGRFSGRSDLIPPGSIALAVAQSRRFSCCTSPFSCSINMRGECAV